MIFKIIRLISMKLNDEPSSIYKIFFETRGLNFSFSSWMVE